MRVLQLTLLAFIFGAVVGPGFIIIEWFAPGTMEHLEIIGKSGDWLKDVEALELTYLVFSAGFYACCVAIRTIPLRYVVNEIEQTIKPIQRFQEAQMSLVALAFAFIHAVTMNWRVGILHFVIGVIACLLFFRRHVVKGNR